MNAAMCQWRELLLNTTGRPAIGQPCLPAPFSARLAWHAGNSTPPAVCLQAAACIASQSNGRCMIIKAGRSRKSRVQKSRKYSAGQQHLHSCPTCTVPTRCHAGTLLTCQAFQCGAYQRSENADRVHRRHPLWRFNSGQCNVAARVPCKDRSWCRGL